MRLGLGTAQFGLDYGVTNARGRVTRTAAHAVLERALERGLDQLDTAPRYGDAEACLGSFGAPLARFAVYTKSPAYEPSVPPRAALAASLSRSLATLGLARVKGLLEHHSEALLGPAGDAVWRGLCEAREAGLVSQVGVSVYTPEELDAVLARYPLEFVQVPGNALDQRFLSERRLADLAARGLDVQVRSVFLQGALLDPEYAAARVPSLGLPLAAFSAACAAIDAPPIAVALAAVAAPAAAYAPGRVTLVVGVEDVAQLDEVLMARGYALARGPAELASGLRAVACENPAVIDPRRWGVHA